MNRFLVVGSFVAGFIGVSAVASGADLPKPAPVYTKAPGAIPYSWNGFYAGVSAGGIWARDNDTWTANPIGFGSPGFENAFGSTRLNGSGVIAGGQLGYNWMVSPQWLLGLEADWSYTGIKAAHDVPSVTVSTNEPQGFHNDMSSHWLATVRGRVGYTAGNWLLYGTGGLALADLRTSDALGVPNVRDPVFISNSSTATKLGWTAGGGVEVALSRAWSTKVEYLYVDVKGNDYVVGPTAAFPLAFIGVHHDDLREHLVRFGLNYHLGN
jgi:outer membrane immunogenic protein